MIPPHPRRGKASLKHRRVHGLGVLGTGTLVSAFHGNYRIGAMIMATCTMSAW